MEAKKVVSLCPACDACPTVEVYDDTVRIGEPDNHVSLPKTEWNRLVEAILKGTLTKI